MEPATIKGATHNPGAPRNWTEANGPCGTLPIIYRKDSYGNEECVSAWKPTLDELKMLNEGGFVILSVSGWQVPVSIYTADKDAATDGKAPERKHTFNEAFMLMWYVCKACGHHEQIWNSRDGITPFGCDCPSCGNIMNHVEWKRDIYAPDHKLLHRQRFWRDGTADEAEAIMRKRIEALKDEYPTTPEKEAELIKEARDGGDDGDFRKGWPMLDEHRITTA